MISRFFIDRPIFASVLSIVITLAGGIALFTLPIAQYPQISPPTVQVDCNYPGASAQVVAETVAAPIEQQVNGVEDMLYMSSQCTNDGSYNLTVTFKHGVDLNMAQVLVQNRVSLAMPLAARRHQADRGQHSEAVARHPAGHRVEVAQRPLRPALPEQLRTDARQGRAGPPAGRRRRDHAGPARLQHAGLGRPGEARLAEHDGRRRGRAPSASRTCRSRPAQIGQPPVARRAGAADHAHRPGAGWSRPSSSRTSSSSARPTGG